MTKEQIYDEQIAPLMAGIIKVCRENRINMHATFDLDNGLYCTTDLPYDNVPVPLRLMHYASKAKDNFDAFMGVVMRDAQVHGHSSVYLKILGVSETPIPEQ